MSDFHGGFFLSRTDAGVQEPVLLTVRAYLERHRIDRAGMRVAVAARNRSPVLHCCLAGGPADGKDRCTFHHRHAALGGEIARAIGATVWAYSFENQVGSELVARFEADGREASREDASWDDLADALGLDDSDLAHARLMAELPLGRLADKLKVSRDLLQNALPLTSGCDLALDGPCDPAALSRYLTGPLLDVPAAPRSDLAPTMSVFFPRPMAEEAEATAKRLGVSLGTVVWAAWEAAKAGLHASTPAVGDIDGPAAELPAAPPAAPPPGIVLGEEAARTAPLPDDSNKVLLRIDVPPRVFEEIRALALPADRSLSWIVQAAWKASRARLLAARRA